MTQRKHNVSYVRVGWTGVERNKPGRGIKKQAHTSRSLRPRSNTSSISVSLVSFESPLSSSSSSPRRASSSSPPESFSLSAAALRMASVLRWTRPEFLFAREAIAGAAKRSDPKKSAYLDQPGSHAACNLDGKKKKGGGGTVKRWTDRIKTAVYVKLGSGFLLRLCPLPDPTWWQWRATRSVNTSRLLHSRAIGNTVNPKVWTHLSCRPKAYKHNKLNLYTERVFNVINTLLSTVKI